MSQPTNDPRDAIPNPFPLPAGGFGGLNPAREPDHREPCPDCGRTYAFGEITAFEGDCRTCNNGW